jgi:hypothetical protein
MHQRARRSSRRLSLCGVRCILCDACPGPPAAAGDGCICADGRHEQWFSARRSPPWAPRCTHAECTFAVHLALAHAARALGARILYPPPYRLDDLADLDGRRRGARRRQRPRIRACRSWPDKGAVHRRAAVQFASACGWRQGSVGSGNQHRPPAFISFATKEACEQARDLLASHEPWGLDRDAFCTPSGAKP